MKCYYTFDEVTKQKVLIPGCMGAAHTDDIDCCTCQDTFKQFEKKRYNEILKEKNIEIQSLRSELKRLVGILRNKNNEQTK